MNNIEYYKETKNKYKMGRNITYTNLFQYENFLLISGCLVPQDIALHATKSFLLLKW